PLLNNERRRVARVQTCQSQRIQKRRKKFESSSENSVACVAKNPSAAKVLVTRPEGMMIAHPARGGMNAWSNESGKNTWHGSDRKPAAGRGTGKPQKHHGEGADVGPACRIETRERAASGRVVEKADFRRRHERERRGMHARPGPGDAA